VLVKDKNEVRATLNIFDHFLNTGSKTLSEKKIKMSEYNKKDKNPGAGKKESK
jgi:small nuclear ribonucleoprotein (snRNP)-like protein